MRTYTVPELEALIRDPESDLVERKESFRGDASRTVRQAVCAFGIDLPSRGAPGVIFFGVRDDGRPMGLKITDELLRSLSDIKTDGNIVPPPTRVVERRILCRQFVMDEAPQGTTIENEPCCLMALKGYRSVMPLAQDARKPMFVLKPADGAIGAHGRAVSDCYKDFESLARRLAERIGLALPGDISC